TAFARAARDPCEARTRLLRERESGSEGARCPGGPLANDDDSASVAHCSEGIGGKLRERRRFVPRPRRDEGRAELLVAAAQPRGHGEHLVRGLLEAQEHHATLVLWLEPYEQHGG